jgi:alkylation response protein AidB-like acyl-CoA dehydrogenase
MPTTAPADITDEEVFRARVATFCHDHLAPRARAGDDGDFFADLLEEAGRLGLLALMFDDERRLRLDHMPLIQETTELAASVFGAFAVALGSLRLQAYLLARHASAELVDRWLEPLLAGTTYGAFGVTEPGAGTDVRAIRTVARRDGDGWRLTGEKCWIGLAPVASFAIVLAKLDHDGRDAETVALVVDCESPGLERGEPEDLLSFRGMPLGSLRFDDVRIPAGHALSVDGFRGMMEGINLARIDAATYACGFLRGALRHCARRAAERTAFEQRLGDLQAIQLKAGRMATDYEAARRLTLAAGESFSRGDGGDPTLLSQAKLFATDAAMRNAIEAVQIFGASGVHMDSDVQRLMRDAKAAQIFDGTSEIHALMIGRSALQSELW